MGIHVLSNSRRGLSCLHSMLASRVKGLFIILFHTGAFPEEHVSASVRYWHDHFSKLKLDKTNFQARGLAILCLLCTAESVSQALVLQGQHHSHSQIIGPDLVKTNVQDGPPSRIAGPDDSLPVGAPLGSTQMMWGVQGRQAASHPQILVHGHQGLSQVLWRLHVLQDACQKRSACSNLTCPAETLNPWALWMPAHPI